MKFNLKNKTAIVTGAGSGIGKAIATTLGSHNAHVHIFELNEELATNTAQEIERFGGKATAHLCDVTNQKEVLELLESISKTSTIDILINNAGIAHIGSLEKTSVEDLDRVYAVNIKGVYNCMYAAIPFMKKSGGVILNMTSIASSVGIADRFAYSMSKGAALTMTYSVAKDYLEYGIRCNCISPARIHTPFVDGFIKNNYPGEEAEMFDKLSKTQPIGRMGKPQEVADLALYLCSDEASFITGTEFPIDGGFIKLNN
ncbi:SDR family NAD(P)-dependent oxidoreductase [Leeuwenhoekiella marinoflava]|uniref:NAD(P)-dependent dehydrogenase (Short-subunit alcohol dehydrogenase family) n=2 Tax=Leeuwenhoekiella marinoflava TaxID=988 RepID=A0A4Q0PQP7_9FLAO|nr:SDR family oxidoreductase [Leeuwenhoekiella marinoflava]RXG32185.1 NAD(P)-dependent dehydrogenase (short-subunit alcohol dehydrogenase family) [Leeuwenhoekiella marinoflava]SHE84158.1 NAD(P)-dependent dehydrogenase, short-chain alcohol dehydrogenase family [Leeuwenhoekiella marinoflava DSM 3653]